MKSKNINKASLLGDFSLCLSVFPDLESSLDQLATSHFFSLSQQERSEKVHSLLLQLIQASKTPCFLLRAIEQFIGQVLERKWLETYKFSQFEFWLNQKSGLNAQDHYLVRAKIMGRYVPRETYQVLFPIGMGKTFAGSHYVTAHGSPDLDTTVASFWGWVDAFSAKVGDGLHLWNVPGGPPEGQVEVMFLFHQLLGQQCFDHFAKTRTTLALSAMDLATQSGLVTKQLKESVRQMEEEKRPSAVVLVDDKGYYLGDWGSSDGESFRKITMLFSSCLRWFIGFFQSRLMQLFSQSILTKDQAFLAIDQVFAYKMIDSEPAKGLTQKQKLRIGNYLSKILQVEKGWNSSFGEFWQSVEALIPDQFPSMQSILSEPLLSQVFDAKGILQENRAMIFQALEKLTSTLEQALKSLRDYADRFEVALAIKQKVFGCFPQVIDHRAEIEEIRSKMGTFSYLAVTMPDSDENEMLLGVIKASDLLKVSLGTVSLRDFCNRDETKIPTYFEVISVVDHHKSSLLTSSAPVAWIADAQSANALVADIAFSIYDQYSTAGIAEIDLEKQLKEFSWSFQTPLEGRIMQRVIQKQMIYAKKEPYFIDPSREYLEYLHYLYAILDDTDLLSKVSYRDVICVVSLLNRMKTLVVGKEVEVISLDDIVCDANFAAKAATRILQNDDMYSLYKKIYTRKEEVINQNLSFCVKGEVSNIFADTKAQNGCNRVGQTKLFERNFVLYFEHAQEIQSLWYKEAKRYYEERKECDLHMHMISTIPSAEDVYAGKDGGYSHQDELWIWIPQEESAIAHLKSFLHAFKTSSAIAESEIEVEFLGGSAKFLRQFFHESFKPVTEKEASEDKKISAPIAILRYKAGLLNSRKAMVSPYLPKLI